MEIINLKKLGNSFKFAFQGIKSAFSEQVFRICCFTAFLVIILMIVLGLTLFEKAILILVMTIVLSFELINSQIEKFLDIIQPNHNNKVKIIKDISAGAVLISAAGALIIGVLIFLPYFIKVFCR